jgi:hypothetical protein
LGYAVGVAFRMHDELGVGCRFLTVDSDQDAVEFYKKMGFQMNLHRDYKNRKYPSMHYDIVAGPQRHPKLSSSLGNYRSDDGARFNTH